jgi:hypothetical protein
MDQEQLKELILKCWMTHDGMWFSHCMQEHGIESANEINKAAIRSLAPIEIERVRKALGIETIREFEELKKLTVGAFSLLTGPFMGFTYSFPAENVLQWEMTKCFAYNGMTRLGAIDRYECGVIYRVANWFDSLGIRYTLTPSVKGCMMHSRGFCRGEFHFFF